MPNKPVPAAAEGVSATAIIEKRIGELVKELSEVLDRHPERKYVSLTVHAASTARPAHQCFDIGARGDDKELVLVLIRAQDALADVRAAVDLIDYCLEGCGREPEINAMQYGVAQVQKEIKELHDTIEQARKICG